MSKSIVKAKMACSVASWDEQVYKQILSTKKLSKASVSFDAQGDFQGKISTEYLMVYTDYDAQNPHKATCQYVGIAQFEGTLQGKTGSFAVEEKGFFEEGTASSTLSIISGSGTSELKGILGQGFLTAAQGSFNIDVEYLIP